MESTAVRGGWQLLLWSGLCFIFPTANNVVPPEIDLRACRLLVALVGIGCLLRTSATAENRDNLKRARRNYP